MSDKEMTPEEYVESLEARIEGLKARCAEMQELLLNSVEALGWNDSMELEALELQSKIKHKLKTLSDCGRGWIGPEKIKEVLELLQKLEWAATAIESECCPYCDNIRGWHTPNCSLSKLLLELNSALAAKGKKE